MAMSCSLPVRATAPCTSSTCWPANGSTAFRPGRAANRWPFSDPRLMSRTSPVPLTIAKARRIWLRAQRLDELAPFGSGAAATPAAVAHLGYVQIDTIHVVERSHHQILYTRIPDYQ